MAKEKDDHKVLCKLKDVIAKENEHLKQRRSQLKKEHPDALDDNKFGIALSGGGIRSATINLGFLKTLNEAGILERADYLSTVSGGGYTGSYIQGTLQNKESYDELFTKSHIEAMKAKGEYMIPGMGWTKRWNKFLLVLSYLTSLLMSWVSPIIIALLFYFSFRLVADILDVNYTIYGDYQWYVFAIGGTFFGLFTFIHFSVNISKNYSLDASLYWDSFKSIIVFIMMAALVVLFFASFSNILFEWTDVVSYLLICSSLIILGFFTNPNALSFHRFYRKRLADAYLNSLFTGDYKNMKLADMMPGANKEKTRIAPYPIINTCLNLQGEGEKHYSKYVGLETSDYFLLSPLHCGSKMTGYVDTKDTMFYKDLTLPTAITISAAAVNPGMGSYSSGFLNFWVTLLNGRLGYWALNPLKIAEGIRTHLEWWPKYFYYEMFSKISIDRKHLSISDGGHIENLAVYELLRRRCRLIICVDAGADKGFEFGDLKNLTIRARNELGIDLRFRKGQIPENRMRPKPSHGYSERRFSVADIIELKDSDKDGNAIEEKKIGIFVYVKSSIVAPETKHKITQLKNAGLTPEEINAYFYSTYNPDFPHESTADQFFDNAQWEAYYHLGRYIAGDVLDIDLQSPKRDYNRFKSIDHLYHYFDELEAEDSEVREVTPRGVFEVEEMSLKEMDESVTRKKKPFKI